MGIIIRRITNAEAKKDKNARVNAATAGIMLMVNRQILRESVNCVSVKGVRPSLDGKNSALKPYGKSGRKEVKETQVILPNLSTVGQNYLWLVLK